MLPQRGRVDAPQPRIHDARVLPGLRDVRGSDAAHRGSVRRRWPTRVIGGRQLPYGDWRDRPHAAVAARVDSDLRRRAADLPLDIGARALISPPCRRPASDVGGGVASRLTCSTTGATPRPATCCLDLFEQLAEPELIQPTFVTSIQSPTSPLARRNERSPQFVDRFELFIAGQEMANAFSELNDRRRSARPPRGAAAPARGRRRRGARDGRGLPARPRARHAAGRG